MKKLSKIHLRTVSETLSENEMKVITGGYEEGYGLNTGGKSPKEEACRGKKNCDACSYLEGGTITRRGKCVTPPFSSFHCSDLNMC